jgi:hypothetical protein
MTNKEMIIELRYTIDLIKQNGQDWLDERDIPILEAAISALQAQELSETQKALDTISRQAAIDAFLTELTKRERKNLLHTWSTVEVKYFVVDMLEKLPSAQPERTCVNCGRTANNGGWYADGGTRCPIEEHYALPKDGFCHLWEKRNVTDDDYPERRTDGRD